MNDPVQDVSQIEQSSGSSVGAMLAAAREAAGINVEDAASQLRLSVRQIRALEADDAQALPAPTFVRGFIRNYAKLLKLDADALLAAYHVNMPVPEQRQISLDFENIPIAVHDRRSWWPYLVASVVAGLSLAGWMIYMEYRVGDGVVTEPEMAPVAVTAAIPAQAVPVAPQAEPLPLEVSAPVAETVEMLPEAPREAASGLARVALSFTEKSWVSVRDHDGNELFNKTIPPGGNEVVEGMPPLRVVVGNAPGVKVSFNDKPVDLATRTGSNVGRITLE